MKHRPGFAPMQVGSQLLVTKPMALPTQPPMLPAIAFNSERSLLWLVSLLGFERMQVGSQIFVTKLMTLPTQPPVPTAIAFNSERRLLWQPYEDKEVLDLWHVLCDTYWQEYWWLWKPHSSPHNTSFHALWRCHCILSQVDISFSIALPVTFCPHAKNNYQVGMINSEGWYS